MSWNKTKIGDLLRFENKSTIKAGDGLIEGKYPFFTSSAIQSKYYDDYLFSNKSIIIGTGGNASIHYCEMPFAVSTDCFVAVAKDESKCYSKYVYYYLQGNIHILEEGFKGAGLKHISKSYIQEIEVPLPPLPIQQRIAEILDTADALRRKDQELLKKYDELAQAIFIDMFGDPVKNEKGWERISLGDVFDNGVKCGPFGSALKSDEYALSGIPVWTMYNILDYEFSEKGCLFIDESKYLQLESYRVNNGDIIISRAGTVGKMCVVESTAPLSIISTNLIRLSLDNSKILPKYFIFLMKYFSKSVGRLKTGDEEAFTHMNTGVLSNLKILLPPSEMQHKFIEFYQIIQSSKNNLDFAPQLLFSSLDQKCFNGEPLT